MDPRFYKFALIEMAYLLQFFSGEDLPGDCSWNYLGQ